MEDGNIRDVGPARPADDRNELRHNGCDLHDILRPCMRYNASVPEDYIVAIQFGPECCHLSQRLVWPQPGSSHDW